MSLHADILVLGAGLAGAATAYHLRRRRVGKIVILEQEDLPGQHATGRNAAMIRAHVADEALRPLLAEGAAALHTGELAEFHRTGSFLIGLGDEDAARYVPLATGRGRFFPNDGVIDPAGLLASYLRGLDVCCGTRVLRWQADASGVRVETPTETWTAGLLVNAAGPWAGHVGALPLRPLNRHLFLTPPMPEVDPDWPFVWDLPNGLYFRPESGGLLLCPCDEEAREAGDYRVSPAAQERLAELLVETQPKLAEIAIRRCWCGQRTFAPDRRFVIGFDPRHPRLFHVAGLGGHGVTASFAVGRLAATLLTKGPSAKEENPFDPARLFDGPRRTAEPARP